MSKATASEKLVPVNLMPNSEVARSILDAKPVRNTPLTLVHWWRYDNKQLQGGRAGARFTLIDLQAKPVWQLDLPTDYEVPGDEKAEDNLRHLIRQGVGILGTNEPGRFDILVAAQKAKKSFSVKSVSGKWEVQEISQVAFDLTAKSKPQPLNLPEISLTYMDSVTIQTVPPAPVSGIHSFTFDGNGQIAFVRSDEPIRGKVSPTTFIQIDQQGKVLHQIPLAVDVQANSQWTGCAWIGGTQFLLTHSNQGFESKSRGWWLDTKTGKLTAVTGFDCPAVDRLLGFADGDWVALATVRHKFTSTSSMLAFDSRGQRRWERTDDSNRKDEDRLFGVKDIVRTSRDEIVILGNVLNTVKVFNREGHVQREFDLAESWKREPNYASSIATDRDGGFIVEDFDGKFRFIRMKSDGSVHAEFTPKYEDGRVVNTSDGVQAAPDGRLWACDGNCLVRLTEQGIVDHVVGKAPQPTELNGIASLTVDRKGQIYAVDDRTGSIHVFDRTGKIRHVCQALPTDFQNAVFQPAMAMNDQEEVYLGLGDGQSFDEDERHFSHFSATGQRLENVKLPANRCYFQPGTGHVVAIRMHEILLIDPSGQVLQTIRRSPNGNWLNYLDQVAVGADGSIAILNQGAMHLYQSNGDPIRTIALPQALGHFPSLAYDGTRAVISGECGLLLVDNAGKSVRSCRPAEWKDTANEFGEPFLVAGGQELLLYSHGTPILHRYELP